MSRAVKPKTPEVAASIALRYDQAAARCPWRPDVFAMIVKQHGGIVSLDKVLSILLLKERKTNVGEELGVGAGQNRTPSNHIERGQENSSTQSLSVGPLVGCSVTGHGDDLSESQDTKAQMMMDCSLIIERHERTTFPALVRLTYRTVTIPSPDGTTTTTTPTPDGTQQEIAAAAATPMAVGEGSPLTSEKDVSKANGSPPEGEYSTTSTGSSSGGGTMREAWLVIPEATKELAACADDSYTVENGKRGESWQALELLYQVSREQATEQAGIEREAKRRMKKDILGNNNTTPGSHSEHQVESSLLVEGDQQAPPNGDNSREEEEATVTQGELEESLTPSPPEVAATATIVKESAGSQAISTLLVTRSSCDDTRQDLLALHKKLLVVASFHMRLVEGLAPKALNLISFSLVLQRPCAGPLVDRLVEVLLPVNLRTCWRSGRWASNYSKGQELTKRVAWMIDSKTATVSSSRKEDVAAAAVSSELQAQLFGLTTTRAIIDLLQATAGAVRRILDKAADSVGLSLAGALRWSAPDLGRILGPVPSGRLTLNNCMSSIELDMTSMQQEKRKANRRKIEEERENQSVSPEPSLSSPSPQCLDDSAPRLSLCRTGGQPGLEVVIQDAHDRDDLDDLGGLELLRQVAKEQGIATKVWVPTSTTPTKNKKKIEVEKKKKGYAPPSSVKSASLSPAGRVRYSPEYHHPADPFSSSSSTKHPRLITHLEADTVTGFSNGNTSSKKRSKVSSSSSSVQKHDLPWQSETNLRNTATSHLHSVLAGISSADVRAAEVESDAREAARIAAAGNPDGSNTPTSSPTKKLLAKVIMGKLRPGGRGLRSKPVIPTLIKRDSPQRRRSSRLPIVIVPRSRHATPPPTKGNIGHSPYQGSGRAVSLVKRRSQSAMAFSSSSSNVVVPSSSAFGDGGGSGGPLHPVPKGKSFQLPPLKPKEASDNHNSSSTAARGDLLSKKGKSNLEYLLQQLLAPPPPPRGDGANNPTNQTPRQLSHRTTASYDLTPRQLAIQANEGKKAQAQQRRQRAKDLDDFIQQESHNPKDSKPRPLKMDVL